MTNPARAQLRARLLTLIPYFDIGDKPTTLQGQPIAEDYRLIFNRTAEALREALSLLGEPETPALQQQIAELTRERDEALKHEGQKDAWIEMLSKSLRCVILAACPNDSWEGSVAEGLDLLQRKFIEVNKWVEAAEQRLATMKPAESPVSGGTE